MPDICGLDIQHATRAASAEISQKHDLLTARECEVSVLIRGGLFDRAISSNLEATEGTIGIHLHNIYWGLEITRRTTLAALHARYTASRNG